MKNLNKKETDNYFDQSIRAAYLFRDTIIKKLEELNHKNIKYEFIDDCLIIHDKNYKQVIPECPLYKIGHKPTITKGDTK